MNHPRLRTAAAGIIGLLSSAWLTAVWLPEATAGTSLALSLGRLSGPGWSLDDVSIGLDLAAPRRDALRIEAQNIRHPALPFPLDSLVIDCSEGSFTDDRIDCSNGHLLSTPALIGDSRIDFRFGWQAGRHQLVLDIPRLGIANGEARLSFRQQADEWRLAINGDRLDLAALDRLLKRWRQPSLPIATSAGSASGSLSVHSDLSGEQRLVADLAIDGLAFDEADGLRAAEDLAIGLEIDLRRRGEAPWSGLIDARAMRGVLYLDPVFVDFASHPIAARARVAAAHGAADKTTDAITLTDLRLNWEKIAQLQSDALTIGLSEVDVSGEIVSNKLEITGIYENILKPFLDNGPGSDLAVSGIAEGRLQLWNSAPRALQLDLDGIQLSDNQGRFGLYDLEGELHWHESATRTSQLRFSGGNLFAFEVGASAVELTSDAQQVALARPLNLPVFDGGLQVDRLVYGYRRAERDWLFEGFLKPVSLSHIANALGWPRMEGRIAGMIPAVRGFNDVIEVEGTLLISAFDGDLTVRNLALEQPFGLVPRLYADVRLANLDLEKLTRTFSFGRISGKLEGEINQLELVNWSPQSFAARLATPADDNSSHRISQRAVDNLSSLGGGASGLFSRGFLGLISDFGYRRLGLSCRLRQGVCRMDGVSPKGAGFLIVEGAGLPRIDVVGFAREVDWDVLVDRLQNISLDNAPVIR